MEREMRLYANYLIVAVMATAVVVWTARTFIA